MIGFLLDGFPVYGPFENGTTLTSASLDVYHGIPVLRLIILAVSTIITLQLMRLRLMAMVFGARQEN